MDDHALSILMSQPTILLDENSCRNAEDDAPGAVIVLDISHRDLIAAELARLRAEVERLRAALKAIQKNGPLK